MLKAKAYASYQKKSFPLREDSVLRYRLLEPPIIDDSKEETYPLIIFLHGSGERGSDNHRQLKHGGLLFLEEKIRQQFPAYVIFPQCEKEDFWAQYRKDEKGARHFYLDEKPNPGLAGVLGLIDELIAKNNAIDPNRVYLMGISMGGMGVLELMARQPDQFAAGIAICGGTKMEFVEKFASKTPLWLIHGAKDKAVPVGHSREIVEQYKTLELPVCYTEYENVGHNCWDKAFEEEDLLEWLFSHRK